jgi:hypothetical protein
VISSWSVVLPPWSGPGASRGLCKLAAVVSKLAGHQTARAVIEAMIAGERDPRVLAAVGRGRMRNEKLPALAEALSGMRFGPQHAHAAASLLRAIDLLDAELKQLQERVTAHLAAIPASWGVDADGVTGPAAGRADGAAVLPATDRLDRATRREDGRTRPQQAWQNHRRRRRRLPPRPVSRRHGQDPLPPAPAVDDPGPGPPGDPPAPTTSPGLLHPAGHHRPRRGS